MADNKTNTLESWMMNLILRNEDTGATPAYIGDDGLHGSAAAESLYISLHTGDPGETGTQVTSEAAYTSYARVAVARSSAGWTQSTAGSQVSNVAAIVFPACTGGGPESVTHFGVGTDASGTGALLYYGTLSGGGLTVDNGITPQFAIGALTIQEQ